MRKWLQSHRGRSLVVGAVAAATVGALGFVVAGPLDAFGSTGTTTGAAVMASAGGVAPASSAGTAGAARTITPTELAAGGAASTAAKGKRGLIKRLLRHSVHASFVVKSGSNGYITVDLDRGALQSVSSTSITILRPDGVSVTAAVTSTTKFVRTPEASLTKGTKVVVVEVSGTARYVLAGRKGGSAPPSTA